MAKSKANAVEVEEVKQEVDTVRLAIEDSFSEGLDKGDGEDQIKMAMIGSGATFKNVTRLYNEFMIDAGLLVSKSDREEIVKQTLDGQTFTSIDEFTSCVDALVVNLTGSNERSAGALIRAYAKKNDLEVYAKPKGEGKGHTGFRYQFYNALIANPRMTEAEAEALVQGTNGNPETSDNVKKRARHFMGLRSLAQRILEHDARGEVEAA